MLRFIGLFLTALLALACADLSDDLLAAARKGDLAAVKALCDKGAALESKTPYGQTPLYLAAMNGHEEVVRLLLERGAETDVKDTFYKAPILAFVIQRKHYGVAKMLIANSRASSDALLADVATMGNAELVQAVLAKGKPSQSTLDSAYETVLDQKQPDIAEALKKAGAHEPVPGIDVDAKILESYVGAYRSDQIPLEIKVSVRDGKLVVQPVGQPEFVPKAVSPTSFKFLRYQLQMDFDSASSFTLKQGQEFKYKKVMAP